YCIPELHRDQAKSSLVSNPGCFATAVQLALAPALRSGLIEPGLHVFAVTGSSGSGAVPKSNTHHPTRAHEVYAYRPLVHQHTPEIRHVLGLSASDQLSFVAHSAPVVRGITVSASLTLKSVEDGEALRAAYQGFCEGEPMLRFLGSDTPRFAGITGTNLASLALSVEGRQVVAFSAIDNLCRGASGQALQNLNRVLGWDESLGLRSAGLFPA
ncbi:MAG: N-acetyl-gamma-glutamyl-phosphate reductase, partial [Planctomycetes bacterium]|nr:N-acetyl-gamma-glutamyl-phosphate reductase [Planctomycetota bacterium]